MEEHPEDQPAENKDGVAMAETMKYAFFMESISIDYNTQRHCNLTRVGDQLDEKGYGIALKKGSNAPKSSSLGENCGSRLPL